MGVHVMGQWECALRATSSRDASHLRLLERPCHELGPGMMPEDIAKRCRGQGPLPPAEVAAAKGRGGQMSRQAGVAAG